MRTLELHERAEAERTSRRTVFPRLGTCRLRRSGMAPVQSQPEAASGSLWDDLTPSEASFVRRMRLVDILGTCGAPASLAPMCSSSF